MVGMLVAYHGAGATFLPEVPKYATANAADYATQGGGKALVDQFAAAFGASFDASIHPITHVMEEGALRIGGIDFVIHQTQEAFDVEIPEINAVYTHMACYHLINAQGHPEPTGGAKLTPGYNLPARYVLHTQTWVPSSRTM